MGPRRIIGNNRHGLFRRQHVGHVVGRDPNASAATSGHTGSGVVFNGTSDYIATTRPAVPSNASLTVSAWVYPTWTTNITRTIAAQTGTASSAYILKWTSDGSGTTTGHWDFLLIGSDANSPSGFAGSRGPTITQPVNTWTHLVGVIDVSGANTKLYVNGADSNTGGGSASSYLLPFNGTGPFQAGRTLYGSSQVDFWQGTIDDVRVWAGRSPPRKPARSTTARTIRRRRHGASTT